MSDEASASHARWRQLELTKPSERAGRVAAVLAAVQYGWKPEGGCPPHRELSGERNGSHSAERLRQPGDHREVGVKLGADAVSPSSGGHVSLRVSLGRQLQAARVSRRGARTA